VNGNACNRGVMVAGSRIDVVSPVINMDVLRECSTLCDFFREKDMVKLLTTLVEDVGVALNRIQSRALVDLG